MKVIPMKTIHKLLKMKTMVFRHYHVIRRSEITKKIGRFDILESVDWVNIIAIDNTGQVVLVKQYRQGTDEITLEIPGGAVDRGEDKLEAAKRELKEETGHTSEQWHYLGEVTPNPAFLTNKCATYLALNCRKTHELNLDAFEEIEVELYPEAEVSAMLKDGRIHHALVVAGFYYYELFKKESK